MGKVWAVYNTPSVYEDPPLFDFQFDYCYEEMKLFDSYEKACSYVENIYYDNREVIRDSEETHPQVHYELIAHCIFFVNDYDEGGPLKACYIEELDVE